MTNGELEKARQDLARLLAEKETHDGGALKAAWEARRLEETEAAVAEIISPSPEAKKRAAVAKKALDETAELVAAQSERVALLDQAIATLRAGIDKAEAEAFTGRLARLEAIATGRLNQNLPTLLAAVSDLATLRQIRNTPTVSGDVGEALGRFSHGSVEAAIKQGRAIVREVREGKEPTP